MLKIIAMLLMVVDHLALAFLPSYSTLYLICRMVGRLSMPLFAYKLACGFHYTHDLKLYMKNIATMTLMAQIPFVLLGYGKDFKEALFESRGLILIAHWNIGVTFLLALCFLYVITHLEHVGTLKKIIICFTLLLLSTVADYGIYGILTILLFYNFILSPNCHKLRGLFMYTLGFAMLTILYYLMFFYDAATFMIGIQLPAVLAIALVYWIPDFKIRLPKSFFYIFYPVHMLIIGLLTYFFSL
ncbi:MAG: TraX family protein [Niameybacter sp.]|uniref:TraX family protein n=1 Tax=Niameybacter sp. TaxID=2033640 RepID=UPI002FC60CDC